MSVAARGVGLFLFIPIVLILYLRLPFGLAPSVLTGIAIMLGHRFLARPFMDRHLRSRCFWCGRAIEDEGLDAPFRSRGSVVAARVCSSVHGARIAAFARTVAAARPLLAAMILVPLAFYLVNALATIAGRPIVALDAARWWFKIPIATAVVALSFVWPAGARIDRPPSIDFPVHNLFLLGVRNTLWVFRLVGLWWLGDGLVRSMLA